MSSLILILLLAMSDSRAMATAIAMWNSIAMIGMERSLTDTYWTRTVGVKSTGCRHDYTILGRGLNTWEAAFAAVPETAVGGPYSGVITLKAEAWDNVAVTGVQFRLDGLPLGPEVVMAPAITWSVAIPSDFSAIPNGVHSLCVTARDEAGNVGRSGVKVFEIDGASPPVSNEIGPAFR